MESLRWAQGLMALVAQAQEPDFNPQNPHNAELRVLTPQSCLTRQHLQIHREYVLVFFWSCFLLCFVLEKQITHLLKSRQKIVPLPFPCVPLFYYTFSSNEPILFNGLQPLQAKISHAFNSPSFQYTQLKKLQNYLTHRDKNKILSSRQQIEKSPAIFPSLRNIIDLILPSALPSFTLSLRTGNLGLFSFLPTFHHPRRVTKSRCIPLIMDLISSLLCCHGRRSLYYPRPG